MREDEASIFDDALLKLARADHFIATCTDQISAYVSSGPHEVLTDGRNGSTGIAIRRPLPDGVMSSAADAVHNLRSALDHCMWALWKFEGSACKESKIYFPIAEDKADFDKKLTNLKPASVGSRSLLTFLEPFSGGRGGLLSALHRIDIIDKHRSIPCAISECVIDGIVTRQKSFDGSISEYKLPPIKVNNRSSQKIFTGATTFGYHFAYVPLGVWHYANPYGTHGDLTNMTVDIKISFAEPELIARMSIAEALAEFRECVFDVICRVRRFESAMTREARSGV